MAKQSRNTNGMKRKAKATKPRAVGTKADRGCQNGKFYATKLECEDANPGQAAKRCDRCRGFHPSTKRTKGGRKRT